MKTELLTQFADIIQLSPLLYIHFIPFISSINLKQFVNISRKKSTSHNPNIDGAFIIMLFNISNNPTAIFLFYSISKHSIIRFKFHKGKSYYRGFTVFMKKTMNNLNENKIEVTNIAVPRNFINNSLTNYFKDIFGVSIIPYSRNLNHSITIIDDIKHQIKDIKELNPLTLEALVNKFNSVSLSYKGLARRYIIFKNKKAISTSINVRNYSTSFSSKKDYNYYIQQINNKISLNIPLTEEDYTIVPRTHVSIDIHLIDQNNIKELVQKFKNEVFDLLKNNRKLLSEIKLSTQFKVQFDDGTTKSISAFDTIGTTDYDFLEKSYLEN